MKKLAMQASLQISFFGLPLGRNSDLKAEGMLETRSGSMDTTSYRIMFRVVEIIWLHKHRFCTTGHGPKLIYIYAAVILTSMRLMMRFTGHELIKHK